METSGQVNICTNVKRLLDDWDASVEHCIVSVARRQFLKQSLSASAALMFSASVSANVDQLDSDQWKTFVALHQHLFPKSEFGPGANDFNASAYLKSVIEWPGVDQADKTFIENGVGWLNDISRKQFSRVFNQLDDQQKEIILRLIVQSSAGERWLSMIMTYLVEALLTDPVYGANTNMTGWQWLEHQPGFPRPSADKRYFNL